MRRQGALFRGALCPALPSVRGLWQPQEEACMSRRPAMTLQDSARHTSAGTSPGIQLSSLKGLGPEITRIGHPCRTSRSDWSMDVTLPRLKVVCDYLEKEQKKENAKPRPAAAVKGMPQAMRPTWEE